MGPHGGIEGEALKCFKAGIEALAAVLLTWIQNFT
jgi:hypothetical protein